MTVDISHLLFILCNDIGLVSLLFQRLAQFHYYCFWTFVTIPIFSFFNSENF